MSAPVYDEIPTITQARSMNTPAESTNVSQTRSFGIRQQCTHRVCSFHLTEALNAGNILSNAKRIQTWKGATDRSEERRVTGEETGLKKQAFEEAARALFQNGQNWNFKK